MKAKRILATVVAVAFVMAFGLVAYAMGPGDKDETGNTPMENHHQSNTGTCPYMSSHMGSGHHMGSDMSSGGHMGNHADADNTGMMGQHLRSGAQMMNHDHSTGSTDSPHHAQ